MKIIHKLILGFLMMALLIWFVGFFAVNASQKALQESLIESSESLAVEILNGIDRAIYNRIEVLQEHSQNLMLQETLLESNREFGKLGNIQDYINKQDQKWTSAPQKAITPFMQELINNKLSSELRRKIKFYEEKYGYKVLGEVFVTNKYGANVAQTGKTTDYRQDDEEWWQKTRKDGLYVRDVKYDESADVYSMDIGLRINDENGSFIGIMKVLQNIEEVINTIKKLNPGGMHKEHKTMEYALTTKEGKLIYSTHNFKFFEEVSHLLLDHEHPEKEPKGFIKKGNKHDEVLIVHAHSRGYRDFNGSGWILLIEHRTKEIFTPVTKLKRGILIVSIFVTILAVLMGVFIAAAIAKPITKLRKGVIKISQGNLDESIEVESNDEMGLLAASFNKMTEDLRKTTGDLKMINAELSALYRISSAISHTINMDELLAQFLDTITGLEMLNVEKRGSIFIIDGDRMNLVSHLGHSEAFLNLHKGIKIGDCLCGLVAKTGEIIISKNSERDSRHTITYPGKTPHGHIIVPLKAMNRLIGVLCLYFPADIEIDEHKVKLLLSIGNQVGIAIDNSRLYEKTKSLSLSDPLTGLANRRLMDIVFERSFAKAKRLKRPFSVIMLDIDYFKRYNDTYGHTAGDKLLVDIANIVLNEIRSIDLVVRYGGEEFLILLPETKLTKAYEVAERIRKTVEAETGITVSLGVSSYYEGIQEKEDLINKADKALYQAKQKGRNRVVT